MSSNQDPHIEVTMIHPCSNASSEGSGHPSQPCLDDQLRAAQRVIEALAGSFSMFSQLKYLQYARSIDQTAPTLHQGVRIIDQTERAAVSAPVLLAKAPGLKISGSCGEAFGQRVRTRLKVSYLTDVGPLVEEGDVPELRLETGEVNCRVRLLVGQEQVYGLQVSAAPEFMGDAGDDTGRVLGQYYRDVRNAQLQKPSGWNALVLSGLPYLRDRRSDNDRLGWILTGVDVAFTSCAVGALAWSIHEHNAFADNPTGSLSYANASVWTSVGCLIALGVERGLATALYR